jgi:hypothetical protein
MNLTLRDWLTQTARFALLVLAQVLLVRRLVLFDTGFCFVYVGFLLFLPIQMSRPWVLILGFLTGFTLDLFYDTGGLHAAACVLIAFLRGAQLRLIRPRDGYDAQDTVSGHQMGWTWWALAVVPLVLVHHTALFWLEWGKVSIGWFTLGKILVSTVFTSLTLLIVQLLFWAPKGQ